MLNLLWGVAVLFFLLWVFGFTFHFTMGGLIHGLLILAILVFVVRIILGRRVT